jgi:predicted helicase
LEPNIQGDWLSSRSDFFDAFTQLGDKDSTDSKANVFFNPYYSYGVVTNRDVWVWNYSVKNLGLNVKTTIDFYSEELKRFNEAKKTDPKLQAKDFITYDLKKISWDNRRLIGGIDGNKNIEYSSQNFRVALYRPFCKQSVYFSLQVCHSLYLQKNYFPLPDSKNILICVSASLNDGLAVLISNTIVDLHFNGDTKCFPLYYYEENKSSQKGLFDTDDNQKYIKRDGISDFILDQAKQQYGKNVTKEDIFYYVYGFLHSAEYREKFASDLKKMLPRLPLVENVKDFWAFSKAGRQLAELHLNYETVAPSPDVTVTGDDGKTYAVDKMRFPKKDQKETIYYNSKITLTNIPAKAFEYVVNGKSAIEWIMERYQVSTHKESGIVNDPNDWAKEQDKPRYILDLMLSIINVSVQTVDIVNSLPKVDFGSELADGKMGKFYPNR